VALGCITLTVLCLKPKDIVNIASGCHKSIAALFTSLFSLPEQQKSSNILIRFLPLRRASRKKSEKSKPFQSASEKKLKLLEKGILNEAFGG